MLELQDNEVLRACLPTEALEGAQRCMPVAPRAWWWDCF